MQVNDTIGNETIIKLMHRESIALDSALMLSLALTAVNLKFYFIFFSNKLNIYKKSKYCS